MNCKHCYRSFNKRHKVADTCLKCDHLIKKGKKPVALQSPASMKFSHSNLIPFVKEVKEVSTNPLLDWMDKKI